LPLTNQSNPASSKMGLITQANRISRDQTTARISVINRRLPLQKIKTRLEKH
jgi:hypothetical protein